MRSSTTSWTRFCKRTTDWCLTFDQRHRVSTVHLVIARAYFIVVGAWVSGLYYARGYLGGGDTSRRGTPNLLAHPSFSWDCGKRERCEVRGCVRLMPPAAFSPLRRRAFLQARAQVDVSWGRTRLPGQPWIYFEQPQVEAGCRYTCETGMRACPRIQRRRKCGAFRSGQPRQSGRLLGPSGCVIWK